MFCCCFMLDDLLCCVGWDWSVVVFCFLCCFVSDWIGLECGGALLCCVGLECGGVLFCCATLCSIGVLCCFVLDWIEVWRCFVVSGRIGVW